MSQKNIKIKNHETPRGHASSHVQGVFDADTSIFSMTARASYEVGANMPPCKLKYVAKKKCVAFLFYLMET